MNLGYSFLDIEKPPVVSKEIENEIQQLKYMFDHVDKCNSNIVQIGDYSCCNKCKKQLVKNVIDIDNKPDIYSEHRKVCNNDMITMTNDGNKTIRCGCGHYFKLNGVVNDGHFVFMNK